MPPLDQTALANEGSEAYDEESESDAKSKVWFVYQACLLVLISMVSA